MLGVPILFSSPVWLDSFSEYITKIVCIPKGWKSFNMEYSFFKIRNNSIRLVLENRILFTLLNIQMFLKKILFLVLRNSMEIWSFQGLWVHATSSFRRCPLRVLIFILQTCCRIFFRSSKY